MSRGQAFSQNFGSGVIPETLSFLKQTHHIYKRRLVVCFITNVLLHLNQQKLGAGCEEQIRNLHLTPKEIIIACFFCGNKTMTYLVWCPIRKV